MVAGFGKRVKMQVMQNAKFVTDALQVPGPPAQETKRLGITACMCGDDIRYVETGVSPVERS
jgi:hypothetical protein